MSETKRKSVYDPVAQKKWEDKNKSKRQVINLRSSCKRFIREYAELSDLEEIKKIIEEREKQLNDI